MGLEGMGEGRKAAGEVYKVGVGGRREDTGIYYCVQKVRPVFNLNRVGKLHIINFFFLSWQHYDEHL